MDTCRIYTDLLTMGDTIVFATTHERLCTKIWLLKSATDDFNMKIHPSNLLFKCFGNTNKGTQSLGVNNMSI